MQKHEPDTPGAKEKYTPAKVIAALEVSAGIRSATARKLQCSVNTVTNYINRYPEIAKALEVIEDEKLDLAEGVILSLMNKQNLGAAIWYLRCKGGKRGWIETKHLAGPDGGPIQTKGITIDAEILADMTDEELDTLERAHKKLGFGGPETVG